MITFRHIKSGTTFGTSRKVMSSFFENNPVFEQVQIEKVDFFISRNPYARAVSLWMDKCVTHGGDETVQHCQAVIREALDFKLNLASLAFVDFCKLLPKIYMFNDHFWPQTWAPIDVHHHIRLDSREVFPTLEGVDWSHKENSTAHGAAFKYYCPESTDIIRRIYQFDFQLLGYKP